jgi:hypothetical protein
MQNHNLTTVVYLFISRPLPSTENENMVVMTIRVYLDVAEVSVSHPQ